MKVRWREKGEKKQGDVVGTVVHKDKLDRDITIVIVRGEDGRMHEVPISRFEP
jgi:hypothetical protein